ncbi:MAG TPA: alpha/beta hydrolase [Blastocatellia bacterium]|nr:alpha/beta hydrolase [Blastocatellia bacterium]
MRDVRVENKYIDVPGGKIFVRAWVPEDVKTLAPVILLHDSLGCVELWRDFPEALARCLNTPVIAYDRLGFGLSTARIEPPSFDFIKEESEVFFPTVLRALSVTDFSLFGHSVGGAMALMIASLLGHRCKAVITEAAQAFVEDRTVAGIEAAKVQFRLPEQFNKLKKWHGEKAQWVLNAWTDIWLSPAFASWSLDSNLGNVHCPVLAIHGDVDEYGSIEFPRRIVSGVKGPAESVILKECGHVPHREHKDEVLQHVFKFMNACVTV